MNNHSNEHLLNVVYQVPEHNIVSPFLDKVDLYEEVVAIYDTDDDILFYQ